MVSSSPPSRLRPSPVRTSIPSGDTVIVGFIRTEGVPWSLLVNFGGSPR